MVKKKKSGRLYLLAKIFLGGIAMLTTLSGLSLTFSPDLPEDVGSGILLLVAGIGLALSLIAWVKEVSEKQ